MPLIAVPCLNEAEHIESLIDYLLRVQSRLGGQIVIADGISTDGTRDIVTRLTAKHPCLHMVDNHARIQSAGLNLAVERFGGDATHLIRIDAHCGYPDDYCDALLDEARRTGAARVVVSMRAEGSGQFQRVAAAAQNAPVGNGGSKHRQETPGEWVDHGHHALFELSAFRDIGGYDPGFTNNEDAEFDHRFVAAGHRIWLTGRTCVTYYPRSSYRQLARQYFRHGSGRACNFMKHRTLPKLRQAKVIAILPLVAVSTLAGFSWLFLLPLAAWIAYCGTMAAVLAVQGRDASLMMAAPMAMVMHLSWSVGFWSTVLGQRVPTLARPA